MEKRLLTLRDRDPWKQVTVHESELKEKLRSYFAGAELVSLGPLVERSSGE